MNDSFDDKWIIINNVLAKRCENSHKTISCDEIYSGIFEEIISDNITRNDIEILKANLQFSKYPVSVKIIVELMSNQRHSSYLTIKAFDAINNEVVIDIENYVGHIIIENTWYPISTGTFDEMMQVLSEAEIKGVGKITLGQYLKLCKVDSDLVQYHTPSNLENYEFQDPEGKLNINATLYPYQIKGWQWLKFMKNESVGGLLADEMGLGKTLQVIALLSSEPENEIFPSLVIAPSTLLENWRREIEKFAQNISSCIHQGPRRTGFPYELQKFNVVITSYDTAVRDNSLFSQLQWQIIFCDEAQAIKNPSAQRTLAIKKIPKKLGIAITGTPIENSLTDLWSIMDFAIPKYLGSQLTFEKKYAQPVDGATKLENIISPLILKRKIDDVAKDLPPKIIIPQILNLGFHEANIYEKIREESLTLARSNSSLANLIRLRMFCTHPCLISENLKDDLITDSVKYSRFIEIVEEIISNNSKMLVFTSFQKMCDLMQQDIANKYQIYVRTIDGRTPIPNRQKIVDEFSDISGSGLLILNPVAAGTGLNITAANHVLHYNLEWNPAKEDQASARAFRRGQEKPVTIHRLYYANTVEEVMNERLNRKRELSNQAIIGIKGEKEDFNDIIRALNISPNY